VSRGWARVLAVLTVLAALAGIAAGAWLYGVVAG
jgi:hypothetical protein